MRHRKTENTLALLGGAALGAVAATVTYVAVRRAVRPGTAAADGEGRGLRGPARD